MYMPTVCPPPYEPRNMSQAAWRAEGYARRIRVRTADYKKAAAEYRASLLVFEDAWQLYVRMLSPAEIRDYDRDVAYRLSHKGRPRGIPIIEWEALKQHQSR